MSLCLDGQFILTEDADPFLVLLSHLHYGCLASLTQLRLATDPTQQTFVPVTVCVPISIEPVQRGVERLWYDFSTFEDGVYEAVSVKEYDYLQTVWLELREAQLKSVTTNRKFALSWSGHTDARLVMSCGHVEGVRVYGGLQRQEQALVLLPEQLCRTCTYVVLTTIASQQNRLLGCAAFLGSPKQISWAETIRWRALQALVAWSNQWDAFEEALGQRQLSAEDAEYYLFCLKVQDQAKWWIDHRYLDLWGLLRWLRDEGY